MVEDQDPTFAHRAHCQLRLERHTQLPHKNYIQLSAELLSYLRCNGDSASRQAQHDDIAVIQVPQPRGELVPASARSMKIMRGWPPGCARMLDASG